jgi:hypothetical protein
MTHFDIRELLPDPLSGVQVRRVGRELLHMNLLRSTGGQARAHVSSMHGRAVPDHQQSVRYVRQQMFEKDHTLPAVRCLIAYHRGESAGHRDPAHHRQMIACRRPTQDRGLSAGGIRSAVAWQERNPRLVHKHEGPAFDVRLFLRWGQP